MTTEQSPPLTPDDWFYADQNHQRQGPVSREALLDLLQRGAITRSSLVWRPGMENWRPLAESLDLPPPDMGTVGFASGIPSGVAEKKKLGGCAIAALVGAALLMIAIPILAILAAIAIPAYQQYTVRSVISGKNAELASARAQIVDYYVTHQRCPRNGEGGIPAADAFGITGIDRVEVDTGEYEACSMTVTFGKDLANGKLDGEDLWWVYYPSDEETPAEWECSSAIDHGYLPSNCQY